MKNLAALVWNQTHECYWTTETLEHAGLVDSKGRTIGTYVTIELRDEDEYIDFKWVLTGRKTYRVRTQATRNGKDFGAITKSTDVASLEDAKALGAKKLAEASKRYAKAVAKGK